MASLITNIAIRVHGKKGAGLTEVKDFLLEWGKEVGKGDNKQQSVEEQKKILMDIFETHNKKIARQSKPPVKKNKR